MAENKKSFVLYADIIHTVKKMPDQKAGLLLKTILSYVNDENPTIDDIVVDLVFEPIKQQLKRDLKEWEQRRAERVRAGQVGGHESGKKRSKTKQNEATVHFASKNEANPSKPKQTQANEAVSVNVNDTVNVGVIDINIQLSSEDQFFEVLRQKTPISFSDALLRLKAKELHNRYKDKKIDSLGGLISKVISDMKPDMKVKFYNPGAASYGYKTIDEWNRIKDNTALQFECYESV